LWRNPCHSPRRPTKPQKASKKSNEEKKEQSPRIDSETLKEILITAAKRGGKLKPLPTTRKTKLKMIRVAEKN
jgi:hypothetical protein